MSKIQEVMAKKMEMQMLGSVQVGQGYVAAKSFEVMKEAASNTGAAGGFMGAAAGLGLGFGAGLPLGQQMAHAVLPAAQATIAANSVPPASADDPLAKLEMLKKLHASGVLTNEEYAAKRATIIEKL